ncbi:MAG: nuclear transport factor 2 family protein [Pseudomonadota bacterium]
MTLSMPELIVQAQVDAYNRRDLAGFLTAYSDAVEVFNFPHSLVLSGKRELAERYRVRFAENPDLRAEIHQRLIFENTVIDHETASGAVFGRKPCIAIYEVEAGLIRRVTFKMAEDPG